MSDLSEPEPRCTACNRVLKDLISVERGMGPVCWKRAQLKAEQVKKPKGRKAKSEVVTDPRQLSFPFLSVGIQP
jgi:hypothetical protein